MRWIPALCLSLAPLALHAEGSKESYTFERGHESARPDARDEVWQYVEANIAETLFHELGHALIDVAAVPVYGQEEYAADTFSVYLLDRLHDETTVQAMARHVAANYLSYAISAGTDINDLDVWDIHGLDMQRYYNFVCLTYGANPDERSDLAIELELPEPRAETCEDEFDLAERSWGGVLDRLSADAPGRSVQLDWVVDENDPLTVFVGEIVAALNAEIVLPAPVMVSVIPCGQSNAFYDPDLREIQICTELGDELARNAR